MKFDFPAIHDIEVEIDERKHVGSWYVIMGDMIVNFNGHTKTTRKPESKANEVAIEFLRQLALDHYVHEDSLPEGFPAEVRKAAHAYLNSFEDEASLDELISSLGEPKHGNQAYQQIAWLCLNAVGTVVPSWKLMCDSNSPEETYLELLEWMRNPSLEVNWSSALTPDAPKRHGEAIQDCDICRLQPITDAVVATAAFLQTAELARAFEAVSCAAAAYDEGCRPQDHYNTFEQGLVFNLLPLALGYSPLDSEPIKNPEPR